MDLGWTWNSRSTVGFAKYLCVNCEVRVIKTSMRLIFTQVIPTW